MRYFEIIESVSGNNLYHFTSFENLLGILKSGAINGREYAHALPRAYNDIDYEIEGKSDDEIARLDKKIMRSRVVDRKCVCTTRIYNPPVPYTDSEVFHEVCIVLDRDKVGQKYRIAPYSEKLPRDQGRVEAEERIIVGEVGLPVSYIKRIIFVYKEIKIPTKGYIQLTNNIKKLANWRGIEILDNTTLINYKSNLGNNNNKYHISYDNNWEGWWRFHENKQ